MDGSERMDLEGIFKEILIGFEDWLERTVLGGMTLLSLAFYPILQMRKLRLIEV